MENNNAVEKMYDYPTNKEYNKKYYQQNRAYWFRHFDCPCGGAYLQANKSKHIATLKHKQYEKEYSEKERLKNEKIGFLKDIVKNKADNHELINKLVTEIFEIVM